jgi:hypothetical protein
MSYNSNKVEWLMESSPHGKFIVRGRNILFKRLSKKSLARLSYLAKKEHVSVRGFIIRCILRGLKSAE